MLPDNPTAVDYLIDVLVHELGVPSSRVNFYDEKFSIPNDAHLFVGVEFKFSKAIGGRNQAADVTQVYTEKQGLITQEHFSVKLFSRNLDAFKYKERAVMALNSIYARQQSTKYGFAISRLANIQDLSELEGAGMLHRYEIPLAMFCRYEYTKPVSWYGTFAGQVTIENGTAKTVDFEPQENQV